MADQQDFNKLTDGNPSILAGMLIDPVTGYKTIVPLKLHQNIDGTWSIDIQATIEASEITIGEVGLVNIDGVTKINPAKEDGNLAAIKTDSDSIVTNTTGIAKEAGGTNATDYKILTGSPCKDVAVNLNAIFTTDYFGTIRPQGSAWDMGFHKFVSTSPVSQAYILLNQDELDE